MSDERDTGHHARVRRALLLGLSPAAQDAWVRLNAFCLAHHRNGCIASGAAWSAQTWSVIGLDVAAIDELIAARVLAVRGPALWLNGFDFASQRRLDHDQWLDERRGWREREEHAPIVIEDLEPDPEEPPP